MFSIPLRKQNATSRWYRCAVTLLFAATIQFPIGTSVRAQESEKEDITIIRIANDGGFKAMKPKRWTLLEAEIWNRSDRDVLIDIYGMFDNRASKETTVQIGRSVLLPARSKQIIPYPIRIPDHEMTLKSLEMSGVDVQSLVFDKTDGSSRRVGGPSGGILEPRVVNTDFSTPILGVIPFINHEENENRLYLASRGVGVDEVPTHVYRTLQAMRKHFNFRERIYRPATAGVPPSPAALDPLDQLVVADPEYSDQFVVLDEIRDWVYRGGRLWIMADRTGLDLAQYILGETVDFTELEPARLSEVTIEEANPTLGFVPSTFTYEKPLTMLRVMADGAEVIHEVNGWPASLWKDLGNGSVLVTTLASEAWSTIPQSDYMGLQVIPQQALRRLGDRMNLPSARLFTASDVAQPDEDDPTEDELEIDRSILVSQSYDKENRPFDEYIRQRIGYSIVTRGHIMAVLGGFCLLVLVGSIVLLKRGRGELILIAGPAAAVFFAGYLTMVGNSSRNTSGNMQASIQWVTLENNSNTAAVRGLAAVFNTGKTTGQIRSINGGLYWPQLQGLEGQDLRILFSDLQNWQWQNLELPAGLRKLPFATNVTFEKEVFARAQFSDQGLTGTYDLAAFDKTEDSLLVVPDGRRISAELSDGSITVSGDDLGDAVTGKSQVDGNLERRLPILEQLLSNQEYKLHVPLVEQPSILTWSNPISEGFEFPEQQEHVGDALVLIPLAIDETPAGSAFTVPSVFLSFQNSSGPLQPTPSGAYNSVVGEWQPMTNAQKIWLKYRLPAQVSPANLTRAVIRLSVRAPDREVQLIGQDQGVVEILESKRDVTSTVIFEIDDEKYLQLEEDGSYLFGFNITNAASGDDLSSPWQISDVQVQLSGTKTQ
jgi:hypothetical protein